MATLITDLASSADASTCPHRSAASVIVVLTGAGGQQLSRLNCTRCQSGWWESDGAVLSLADAIAMIQAAAHLPRTTLGATPGATSKAQHPSAYRPPGSAEDAGGARSQRGSGGAQQTPANLQVAPTLQATAQASPAPAQGPLPPARAAALQDTPAAAGSSQAFRALLSWAGDALGTEHVLFAAPTAEGWSVTVPRPKSTGHRPGSLAGGAGWSPAIAKSLHDERLLANLAGLRGPVELSGGALATVSPDLARAGVLTVLGSPVYAPSGALAGLLIAAYRPRRVPGSHAGPGRPTPSGALAQSEPIVSAGPETIGCIARLLGTAHHHLAAYRPPEQPAGPQAQAQVPADAVGPSAGPEPDGAPPRSCTPELLQGDPSGLLLAREVSKVFAVSPRTVANWVTSGMLTATRTAGGHLRFRRGDVAALFERREGEGVGASGRPAASP